MRTILTAIALGIIVAAAEAGAVEGPSTHPRIRTIAALEAAAASRAGWLEVSLVGGAGGDVVRVGDSIEFAFASEREAHLVAVHVDGEGNLTLLFPAGEGGRLRPGDTLRFPSEEPFDVVLPIGSESVFAFATPRALDFADLGLEDAGGYASIGPEVGPDFASCLSSHLDRLASDAGAVAAAQLAYRVTESGESLPYTTRGVEQYFTTVTRSFQRPTLDLRIHFDSGSADLRENARAKLDEVGRALAGSRIGTYRFALNGHTDDVGDDTFNLELSRRRAEAARSYLTSKHGVDPARLEIVGHGEGLPKVAGMTPEARELNRRVELELTSRGTRAAGGAMAAPYRCGP